MNEKPADTGLDAIVFHRTTLIGRNLHRESVAVFVREAMKRNAHLLEVVKALDAICLYLALGHRRQQERSNHNYDGNHRQQLQQCECRESATWLSWAMVHGRSRQLVAISIHLTCSCRITSTSRTVSARLKRFARPTFILADRFPWRPRPCLEATLSAASSRLPFLPPEVLLFFLEPGSRGGNQPSP